jgi:hypothetical protein
MTPGNLVRAVSAEFDIPHSDVLQYDRRLAEMGLRTSGGRGPSAPNVTFSDAANLISASILGGPLARIAETVRRLNEFTFVGDPVPPGTRLLVVPDWTKLDRKPLSSRLNEAVVNRSNFGVAFAALLADCADGFDVGFKLTFETRELRAQIKFKGLDELPWSSGINNEAPRILWRTTHDIDGRHIVNIAKQIQ